MIVFKLSWLPWIFIIGGIGLLADGEAAPGIILAAIGVIWLVMRRRSKSGGAGTGTNKSVSAPPAPKATSGAAAVKCSHCGAENRPGSLFCESCGSTLN